MVPKSTNTDTVTAVSVEEKLADEGHEVQTESHPSQTSKEPTSSENVQAHPVTIPVIGDIAPNSPYEQKEIGCSLNSYRGYLLNINKIQNSGKGNTFSLQQENWFL